MSDRVLKNILLSRLFFIIMNIIMSLFLVFLVSEKIAAKDLIPYIVFLKKGTVLTTLKDPTKVILSKDIYAKALEIDPKTRDQFYIYDKNGVALYQTSAAGITEIASDIQLLPTSNPEAIYPPKDVFKTSNQHATFHSLFNLHFDSFDVAPFNDIYHDSTSRTMSTRYEMRTLYTSEDFFLKFGFAVNYQTINWDGTLEKIHLSILSLGPHFQYTFYKRKEGQLNAIFGAELAPLYRGSSAQYEETYSAQLYDIGLESAWTNALGIFTFGTHLRHHVVALKESNRKNVNLFPQEFSLNTIGLMLGYKIEWEL